MTETTELSVQTPVTSPTKAGGMVQAIVPQNSAEAFSMAKAIFTSRLAPPSLDSAEKVMVVMMKGAEVGFAPMQALSTISLINGRLSIFGDGLPAVVYRAGGKLDETVEGNGDARTATCVVTRPDGHSVKGTFSIEQAKKARLWGKSGPWSLYPERMLKMRARGFAVRDGMPDALNGLFIAEDIQDAPAPAPAEPGAVPASANRLQARLGTTSADDEVVEAETVEAELPVIDEPQPNEPDPSLDFNDDFDPIEHTHKQGEAA